MSESPCGGTGGPDCTCGCCAGVVDRTPLVTENRPGLSRIAYRVGSHSDFLASMIAGLTDAQRPRLRDLTTRDPDDFTIGLLDSWAVSGDVLTFYNERLAQESYLRTSVDRTSLQELGRLIGYRLRPGVAAEAYLAFATEAPPAPPAPPPGTAAQPGSLPPVVPPIVSIPVGLRVQSIPGPGEQPQTFETIESLDARTEWAALPASRTRAGIESTTAWLDGAALNLKKGDLIMWSSGATSEFRFLDTVTPDPTRSRTRVTWKTSLASFSAGSTPTATVFRKQLAMFGHNAPAWNSMSDEFQNNYGEGSTELGEWPNFTDTVDTTFHIHLDGSHTDVVEGATVAIAWGASIHPWTVTAAIEGSWAEFALSGKIVHLEGSGSNSFGVVSPRDIVVYAVSEVIDLAQRDDLSTVTGGQVAVDAPLTAGLGEMSPGRRLMITGRDTQGNEVVHVTTFATADHDGSRWTITFDDDIVQQLDRSTVVVHANVALATHGETVGELLGSGRANAVHQRFTLKNDPLTYVQSTEASGTSPTLEVRVNDLRWGEVPTLYGTDAAERAYTVRNDEQGRTVVQFGDGEHGARLPTGSQNVRARDRKGIGVGGNVGPAKLANLLDRPLGLKGVSNPAAAVGGVDPEPASAARESIPLAVRTLGRAVSVLDYEDFARSFAGVSKASASVLRLRSGPTIVVTVAFGELGTDPVGERLEDLTRALETHGDPHAPVQVINHVQTGFRLALKVAVDPAHETDTVLDAVSSAIAASFSFPQRRFGASVEQSQVIAVAHTVPGVLAIDLDRLYLGASAQLAQRLVAPAASVTAAGTASPAGVLIVAPTPFDWLEAMT